MKVNFLSFTSGNKPIIGGKFPKRDQSFLMDIFRLMYYLAAEMTICNQILRLI